MTAAPAERQLAELEASLTGLLGQARAGDPSAYGEFLKKVKSVLEPYFTRHLRRCGIPDPVFAEDLVQEALIAIHEKRLTYDPAQRFTPWMYAIARYKLIDQLRKRRNLDYRDDIETADDLTQAFPESPEPAGGDVATLLGMLSEKQRRVLELAKLEGHSLQEVARETGMTVAAVKVTIHRAIKSLKARMEEEGRR